jgi:hypothetical protein
MYRIFRSIRDQEKREEREQERRRATSTKKTCEYCQKSFTIQSVENSWCDYSRQSFYYWHLLPDVRFCCELHYKENKEYMTSEEAFAALKRHAAKQKWTKEHTFTCEWCKEKFISDYKSSYCNNPRCVSERRYYEKHLK